ncbi:MAG: right-handed parallel beta-helix repeat-containing protein [Candidatus Cloacimonetes bacterium]|nr:right-handed parallel beta-helix repeat-containing protein [Candidatus Cloacimonadota bacterium]
MRKQAKWILLIVIVVISAQVLSAQTNVSGEVSGTWTLANSPYIVVGNISIVGDSLLVIEAGVEVRFDGFYQFVAYGILSAIGTESDPILFTSNASTPNPGDWYNIELSDFSIMQHCIVEYAGQPEPSTNKFAIRLNGDCEIFNNIIRHNNVSGIGAIYESSIIRRNLIYDNSTDFFVGAGIYSQWSSAKIENNTIADNNFGGMLHQANSDSLTVINNIIVNNSGVGFQYDQITGSPFPIADYNDVWGNTTNYMNLTPGEHSISEDPLFVGTGDYHLTADSPCIDAGDPAFPLDPDGTIADMGAFYYNQTGLNDNIIIPTDAHLYQNYPNPFNPSTTITFSVTQTSPFVTLEIYNLKGQKVKTLETFPNGGLGTREVVWDGTNENDQAISSGIYFYKLNIDGKTEAVRKCLLMK